jgi:CRP-like cAMP-binding protein
MAESTLDRLAQDGLPLPCRDMLPGKMDCIGATKEGSVATVSAIHAEAAGRRLSLPSADMAVLSRIPMFSGLPPSALQTLLADAHVQSFPEGSLLFLQDEPAVRCYVVLEGWVKLFRTSEGGEETVIGVFTGGESFAEAALFDRARYPVNAAAIQDCRALVIPAEPFIRHLSENGEIAIKVLAAMSRRLRSLVQQVEQLKLKSTTERVADFLVKLTPEFHGPVMLRLPMEKALIAGRLGMQPETFSRALAKLRRHGVTCNGASISIADIGVLRRLVAERDRPPCAVART